LIDRSRGRAWPWAALVGLWIILSVAALALPAPVFDWQPERALAEPWRAWTALFIHWSDKHLLANLAAAAVVAAYGHYAPVGRAQTLALFAAWPLTHALLGFIKPDLLHYGGLSGVLHAGVAIVSLTLVVMGRGGRRAVGAAVMLGLVIKLASESPWGPALQRTPEFDIAVAPAGHLAGAIAGLACGALALLGSRRQSAE
jgi:rhomboid family GlyGly-CTERM serine protease